MITRRQFLGTGAAGLSYLSLSGALPTLFARAADAATVADTNDNVLVVVELNGGNDGLNTVIPFENPLYAKNRPTLQIPKDEVLKLADGIGLHPSLSAFGELFKEGKLAVVQGVGYPDPDRSHFRSMEIWHTGSLAKTPPTIGWLGRVLDQRFPEPVSGKLPGLALTSGLPQAFLSEHNDVPVVQQLDGLGGGEDGQDLKGQLQRKLVTSADDKSDAVGYLRRQATTVFRTAAMLREASQKYKSTIEYPGDLGEQLRRAVQAIAADIGVRLLFVSQGGYDTHSQQAGSHAALLSELSGALAALQKDLEGHGLADRVCVLVFSEFGRRVDENGSQGTDHGAASIVFVQGAKVRGGLKGEYPSLEKLGDGDLIHTVDFRSVYATIMDRWLGCSSKILLGSEFPAIDCLAG